MNIAARIAELEKAAGAVPSVTRSIVRALRSQLLGELEPQPPAVSTNSVRTEPTTNSALAPEGSDCADISLPETYGRDRLVMLVVDPHQVHAYWEVTTQKLGEAQKTAGSSALQAAVLRFHVATPSASPADSFDVPVKLHSRSWYVHLASPDKSFYAELGLKSDSGEFFSLVRSNEIRTPRTWPVAQLEEHFMQVDPVQQRAEPVSPPAFVHPHRDRPALSADQPLVSGNWLAAQRPLAAPPSSEIYPPGRINSEGIMKRKLAALFGFGQASQRRPQIQEASSVPASDSNLTDLAEQRFVAGIFSRPPENTADKT